MPNNQEQRRQKLLENSVKTWKAMYHVYGLSETSAFLSLFNYEPKQVEFIIEKLFGSTPINKSETIKRIIMMGKHDGVAPDFKSTEELINTINAWNAMLKVYDSDETFSFLSTYRYSKPCIKFLIANLHLPDSMDRVAEAERIIKTGTTREITDSVENENLVITIQFLNKMIKVHGPNETLSFLSTCNYNDQSIKFLTANLHLPDSMDRKAEAEKIIKMDKAKLIWDFPANENLTNLIHVFKVNDNKNLVKTIQSWKKTFDISKPETTLKALSNSKYRPKYIKLIMANLSLPKTMNRSFETERIIESNKKNILLTFKKSIDDLSQKKLKLSILNNFVDSLVDSFEFSKSVVDELRKELILKTQKEIEHNITDHLDEIKLAGKREQVKDQKKQVEDYIKQIQHEPNEIETYLDKVYLKELREKEKNASSQHQLTDTKNKNVPKLTK